MKNFTNNDVRVGQILTTKNGSKYVVVADDNGHHDVINVTPGGKPVSNGVEVASGRMAVCGGKNGSRDVVMVEEFVACPTRNRLSEALKTLTGHPYTEKLAVIWSSAHEQKIKKAKAKVEQARNELNDLINQANEAQRSYESALADLEEIDN